MDEATNTFISSKHILKFQSKQFYFRPTLKILNRQRGSAKLGILTTRYPKLRTYTLLSNSTEQKLIVPEEFKKLHDFFWQPKFHKCVHKTLCWFLSGATHSMLSTSSISFSSYVQIIKAASSVRYTYI